MMKRFCDDWILFGCKALDIIFRYRCSNVLYLHDSWTIYPRLDALETKSDACVEDDTRRCFARPKQVPSIAGHCIHNAYHHDHHQAYIIKIHTTLILCLPQKHREEYFKALRIAG